MDKLEEFIREHEITEVECLVPDMSGIARGTTPTIYHLSEVASFTDAQSQIEDSLFKCVHASPKIFGCAKSLQVPLPELAALVPRARSGREQCRLRPVGDIEAPYDLLDMRLDCALGHVQRVSDQFVRLAYRD